jgi:WD40 repeat protein
VRRTLPLTAGDEAYDLSFSPDGSRLALGGLSGLLYVYDTATWQPLRPPDRVHDERVLQVEWLPGGRDVLSAGREGSVSLYDTVRGLVRARLPASDVADRGYTHLVPGTTGEVIALSGERPGRRYPTDPARWLAEACTVAGRDLTEAEWSRYLPGRQPGPTCSDLS